MSTQLTKQKVQTMMNKLERQPTFENMQAAAKLLNVGFERDIDGGLIYRGAYCPDQAELVDEILCDLGNKRNSIGPKRGWTQTIRDYPPVECPQSERESWGL